MSSQSQSSDIQQLLFDSAVQIAVLDGTDNDLFRKLLAELQGPSQVLDAQELESGSSDLNSKPLRKFTPSEYRAPEQAESERKQSG